MEIIGPFSLFFMFSLLSSPPLPNHCFAKSHQDLSVGMSGEGFERRTIEACWGERKKRLLCISAHMYVFTEVDAIVLAPIQYNAIQYISPAIDTLFLKLTMFYFCWGRYPHLLFTLHTFTHMPAQTADILAPRYDSVIQKQLCIDVHVPGKTWPGSLSQTY